MIIKNILYLLITILHLIYRLGQRSRVSANFRTDILIFLQIKQTTLLQILNPKINTMSTSNEKLFWFYNDIDTDKTIELLESGNAIA